MDYSGSDMATGTLYVVATPIGNLDDISLRALRVLKEVDAIAAEDTRRSLKLLSHFGISKPLISYWSEREKSRTVKILEKLRAGLSVALISDSGTPGISDPGGVLVREALQHGITVRAVPGPSALVAAISASGLPGNEFTFVGFLPARGQQRRKKLTDLAWEQRTLIFYEAPHRLLDTIVDMEQILGNRRVSLFKEITKMHEETLSGSLCDIINDIQKSTIAGEYVIVSEGWQPGMRSLDEAVQDVIRLMKAGKGRKEAATLVAEQYGLSRRSLYERSLHGVSDSPD